MIIFKTETGISDFISQHNIPVSGIGFVPTMGALHPGHLSLIKQSKATDLLTICSIFVNPAQFNEIEDYNKYPETVEEDINLLEKAGCDLLFLPPVNVVYPKEFQSKKDYDLGLLETNFEGKYRPGHFQGVCMVVERLMDIIPCKNLYLGQKDYQQCMVIKKLIELTGKDVITIVCPTLREPDGLAMSSRNMRLNTEEREKALSIFKSLSYVKDKLKAGDLKNILQEATDYLTSHEFKVDYLQTADAYSLEPKDSWDGKTPLVILAAAYLNNIRLIDNITAP